MNACIFVYVTYRIIVFRSSTPEGARRRDRLAARSYNIYNDGGRPLSHGPHKFWVIISYVLLTLIIICKGACRHLVQTYAARCPPLLRRRRAPAPPGQADSFCETDDAKRRWRWTAPGFAGSLLPAKYIPAVDRIAAGSLLTLPLAKVIWNVGVAAKLYNIRRMESKLGFLTGHLAETCHKYHWLKKSTSQNFKLYLLANSC